jgi:nitrate reductase NapE component
MCAQSRRRHTIDSVFLVLTVVILGILAIGPLSGMVGAHALPAPAASNNLLENGEL